MNIKDYALEAYKNAQAALDAGDTSVFPGDQLAYAKEFRDAIRVQYPKPYGRYVPLLQAYWIYFNGSWWYVVHDMITFDQVFRRYLSHTDPSDKSIEVANLYNYFWNYQPEFFKSEYTSTQNFDHKQWHLPEGWPIKMPPEAVQYAKDVGLLNSGSNQIFPIPDIVANNWDLNMQLFPIKAKEDKPNYWAWGLGSLAVLSAIGTGIYFWKFR